MRVGGRIKCDVTFYRRNLPHLQRDDKTHFVTFVTKKRSVLPSWAATSFSTVASTITERSMNSMLPWLCAITGI